MSRISGGACSTWVRADIDGSDAIPNRRHPSSPPPSSPSSPSIGVLTVFASCGMSGSGGRMSASTASTWSESRSLANTPVAVSRRVPPHASRNTPPDSRTITLVAAKSQTPPSVMIATSSSPVATMTASSAKHWLRGVDGGVNRFGTSLRHPRRNPSNGVTITDASSSDGVAPHRSRSAAVGSNDPPGSTVPLHAPPSDVAHQRRPSSGADTRPSTGPPSSSAAMMVLQPGRPAV